MANDGLNEICVVNSNTEAKTLVGCTKGTELEIEGNDKTLSPEIILGRNGFKLVSAIKENQEALRRLSKQPNTIRKIRFQEKNALGTP